MTLRSVTTHSAPAPVAAYSQAIDAERLVFVSGQIGLDPNTRQLVEGVEAQAERALRNIVAVLDACGLSFTDVAKSTILLSDIANFDAVNDVYARFVGDPAPARTTFAVAGLPRGALVEIEVIAARV
jgi:2-iminobutanoate/2-iminopropanoate deaminase